MKKNHRISIILPVYDETQVFSDIKNIKIEFEKLNQDWEIICVFDSSLEKSADKLKLAHLPGVKIFFYPLSRFGKGFAFCYGFNQSTGNLIFFWEGNFHISPRQFFLFINLLDLVKADIVVGSKRHPLSLVSYSPFRRFCSKIYQLAIKILFGLNVSDTQVGLKLYRRQVLEKTIPKIIIKNWAFDLEILVVAHNLGFKRVIDAPIEIKKRFTGKKLTFSSVYYVFRDTLAIFYRKKILKYYQQKFV